MKRSALVTNPVTVIGVIVSVAISIIFLLLGIDEVTSLIIGLLGIVISLLIEILGANSRLEEKIFEALELTAAVQKEEFAKERISIIIKSWGEILEGDLHPVLINVAKLATQEACDQLTSIANGEIHVTSSDYGWMSVILDEAQSIIRATSTISMKFWNSNAGKRWREANYAAISKGIIINRIFLYETNFDSQEDLMKEMHQNGVRVYHIEERLLPPDHRFPMVLVDENLLWVSEKSDESEIYKQHFSVRADHILRHKNIFERILMESEEYSP